MAFEGMGEMFEGDFADMCAIIFLLVSMGGLADCCACADMKVRTPIVASGYFHYSLLPNPGEAKAKAMPGRLYIHTK